MYPPKYRDGAKGREPVTWRDECRKFVSQVWFFGAAVVRSRHYRAHPSCNTALDQAVRRKWDEERAARSGTSREGRIQGASTKGVSGPCGLAFRGLSRGDEEGLLTLRVDFGQPKSQHGAESWIIRRLTNRRAGTGLHMTGSRN